ncbi:MAG: class I adenylate-forming enzyme family protein [Gemmataceae bacterium]
MDFASILEESANRHPDLLAVATPERSLTYAELVDQVSRLAGAFVERGLAPGDRVVLLLPNGLDLVLSLLALARAELIAVPLLSQYASPQVDYAVRQSEARVLITTPALLAKVTPETRSVLDAVVTTDPLDHSECFHDWFAHSPVAPVRGLRDPISLILYTSGTTRRPKGVAHTQRRLAQRVDRIISVLGLTGADSTLLLPDAGRPVRLLGQLLALLRVGGSTTLLPSNTPVPFWAEYTRRAPTYLFTLPGEGYDLLDHPAARSADHSALRFWITGGDRASNALHQLVANVVNRPLLEMCGMSECGFYAINPPAGLIKVGSIGLPLPGYQVRLVDDHDREVPQGKVGEVMVRSPDVMVGYWNDTLLTHRTLIDGWILTGDLARTDEDGYLWFVGRAKEMICRGGWKVAPAMVEEFLLAHPAVNAAVVVGISDPRSGQVPFAFYTVRPGQSDPGFENLSAWLTSRLEQGSVPVGFARIEQWPLTAQGKLDRARLAWMAEAGGTTL